MRNTNNPIVLLLIGALVAATAAACGGRQDNDEEVVIIEEPPDIPGVEPRAVQAFVDGIRAMEAQPVDYEEALAQFEAAVEADENFWEAYENIGLIQLDLARYDEAIAAFESEMAVVEDLVNREWPVDPRPEIWLNIGKAYALAGRYMDAAGAFQQLLELDPENVEARANLAALNAQQGNLPQARDYISDLLEMSQNDVGALNVLARIYQVEGDDRMAAYLWEKCVGVVATTRESLEDESQYEDLTEDEQFRLRLYNEGRIRRLTRVLSDVQNELGIQSWAAGNHDEAESFFRSAVGNNPYNYAALTNLGTVYVEYAFFTDACYQFGEALALRPRNEQALIGFAACTYGTGDVEGGYAAYETVHENYPNNEFAVEQLGNIAFRDLGDSDQAYIWYTQHLEMRGLTVATCDNMSDRVCAAAQSIDMIREQQSGQ